MVISLVGSVEWSVVDVAGAGGGGDAGLDRGRRRRATAVVISPLRRSRTAPSRSGSTQPKQMPIRQPRRHQHAGVLGGVEDRGGAVGLDRRCRCWSKVTVPPSPATSGRDAELLGEQRRGRARRGGAARASSRPAGPQAKVVRSAGRARASSRSATSRMPCASSYRATSRMQPGVVERAQVVEEDRVGLARRDVHDDDVVAALRGQAHDAGVGDREEVAQHPDHRGDAGAGGDEQQLAAVGRQHELAGRLLEVDQRAGRGRRGRGGC